MAKIISNNAATMPFHKVQRKAHNSDGKQFTDLNADDLLLIFDELDIISMLNILDVYQNGMLSSVASMSFRRKYKEHPVYVERVAWLHFSSDYAPIRIIASPNEVAKMLKHFRGEIEHLEISEPSTIVCQYMNKYASDSLIKLKMNSINNDTFSYFTKPFNRLQEVTFCNEIIGSHLPLDQLFPNIRALTLDVHENIDFSFILCEFRLLEHFGFHHPFNRQNESFFDDFFRKNSQITSINIGVLTQYACDVINQHATHLENITISTHSFDIEHDTTFAHVKSLQISKSIFSTKNKLFFPRLNLFKTEYSKLFSTDWIEFYKKHRNVTILEISNIQYNNADTQLIEAIDKLPNLIEITLKYSRDAIQSISFETIRKIIERHGKLEILKISDMYYHRYELEKLQEKFENYYYY